MTEAPSFTPELFTFLRDLAANNDREWFAANKARYVAEVQEPALAFVEDVGLRLPDVSRHFVADARTTDREDKRVAEPARGYAVMDTETLEKMLEQQMREAATAMDFELAAQLRDQLFELRARGAAAPVKGRSVAGGSRAAR